jgi:hypothetical protein
MVITALTNADKRRAVLTLLEDPEWREWSDSAIAQQCHVSRPLVAEMRAEQEAKPAHPAELQDSKRIVKRCDNTYSMNVPKKRGQDVRKQTPSPGLPAEMNSVSWIDLLLNLPKHAAANETARGLGWIKDYDELHKAAQTAN